MKAVIKRLILLFCCYSGHQTINVVKQNKIVDYRYIGLAVAHENIYKRSK
jgi:hypothetical protein